jgi:hypothetical protein
VHSIFDRELLAAALAGALDGRPLILSPAMRIERCCAIWTHDLKILDAIVVRNAVDVIEDQGHRTAPPKFVLATLLTPPRLQTLLEQTQLQLGA